VGLLELNGDSFSIYDLKLNANEVYVIKMQINYENDAAFIPDVDPVLVAFSSVLCRGTENIWLGASFVRKEDNKYYFAFSISEPGIYDIEFMVDDYVITIFGVVVE
jgi:hypothetical protein